MDDDDGTAYFLRKKHNEKRTAGLEVVKLVVFGTSCFIKQRTLFRGLVFYFFFIKIKSRGLG